MLKYPDDFRRCKCGRLMSSAEMLARFERTGRTCSCGKNEYGKPNPDEAPFMDWLRVKLGVYGWVEGETWRIARLWREPA